jgi:flavin-binding protein dodecin
MPESLYDVILLIGSSKESWEKAAAVENWSTTVMRNGTQSPSRASRTVRQEQ